MRITKVALAFFSIGFLAGSFERAAGLADAERPKRMADRQVDTTVARGTRMMLASAGFIGGGLPDELRMPPAVAMPPEIEGLGAAFAGFDAGPAVKTESLPGLTALAPLNPDFRHRSLLAKKSLSEPDPLAISRVPVERWMSLPSSEPWDFGPRQDSDGARGGLQELAVQEFIMPFERGRISSGFNQGRRHPAIDFAGALGQPVHATTRRQRVVFAGWRGGYGNAVIARDESGRQHLYGHLQSILVRVGTLLDQGQVLGKLGSTGHSTGPHVHYEVRGRAGGHVNPLTLLFPGRRVGRGFAWNGSRSVTPRIVQAQVQAQGQPRPR